MKKNRQGAPPPPAHPQSLGKRVSQTENVFFQNSVNTQWQEPRTLVVYTEHKTLSRAKMSVYAWSRQEFKKIQPLLEKPFAVSRNC